MLYNIIYIYYGVCIIMRNILIDFLRISSALLVCAFHIQLHLHCSFGFANGFVSMGHSVMTLFFVLSGYCLYAKYSIFNMFSIKNIKYFWLKRAINILPVYYLCLMLCIITSSNINIQLSFLPIDLFCLQAFFPSSFNLAHHGGTWFISCIILCYFLFPFFQELLKRTSTLNLLFILLFICLILFYSPRLVHDYKLTNIYSNFLFRFLEFFAGMLIYRISDIFFSKINYSELKAYVFPCCTWGGVILGIFLYIFSVTWLVDIGYKSSESLLNRAMYYTRVVLPSVFIILFFIKHVTFKLSTTSLLYKCIVFSSKLSFVFYLSQMFSNAYSKKLFYYFNIEDNFLKIFIAWLVCFIIAMFLYFFYQKMNIILLNKLNKTINLQ